MGRPLVAHGSGPVLLPHLSPRNRYRPKARTLPGALSPARLLQSQRIMKSMDRALNTAAAGAAADPSGPLLGTCLVMLIGAYTCGTLPMLVQFPATYIPLINAAGAGLLMGSSLWVILPEGFAAAADAGSPSWLGAVTTMVVGYAAMYALDVVAHRFHSSHDHDHLHAGCSTATAAAAATSRRAGALGRSRASASGSAAGSPRARELSSTGAAGGGGGGRGSPGLWDIESGSSTSSKAGSPRLQASRDKPGPGPGSSPLKDSSSCCATHHHHHQHSPGLEAHDEQEKLLQRSWSDDGKPRTQQRVAGAAAAAQAILPGLCIHAAADGIAVGTAALSPQPMVTLAVAVAMVVHKGPVAIGLGLMLQGAGWSFSKAQQGLLLFAATSPVFAVLTYALLRSTPQLSSEGGLAWCLLLSGGTVMYAATHALQALVRSFQSGDRSSRLALVCAYLVGLITPKILFMMVHDHAHTHGHGGHVHGHEHEHDSHGD